MDPSYPVSMMQAGGGGVMVWGMSFWHTLGLLTTNISAIFECHIIPKHCLLTLCIPSWPRSTFFKWILSAG
uniref:Uncharacterized protein n=1 Tax=Anguilla anguilla TaxID=7936 RepID=A0A0E9PZ26_ANGAN